MPWHHGPHPGNPVAHHRLRRLDGRLDSRGLLYTSGLETSASAMEALGDPGWIEADHGRSNMIDEVNMGFNKGTYCISMDLYICDI